MQRKFEKDITCSVCCGTTVSNVKTASSLLSSPVYVCANMSVCVRVCARVLMCVCASVHVFSICVHVYMRAHSCVYVRASVCIRYVSVHTCHASVRARTCVCVMVCRFECHVAFTSGSGCTCKCVVHKCVMSYKR